MDVNREIKRTVDTGKVILGANKSINSLKTGNAKLIIYTQNCPKSIKEDILYYSKISSIPILEFGGTSLELGTVCGKPFLVSVIAVLSPGESNILSGGKVYGN